MALTISYPFDPSGALSTNLITGEEQSLALSNNGYMFIVPFAGPYFKSSLKVVQYPGAKVLKEGVDYACTHYFKSASLSCAKPIYGSITFYNKLISGKVQLQYQTVGGEWVINQTKALSILANTLLNPRIAYWEQIVDLPYAFPPIEHAWSVDDLVGMSQVVAALQDITSAIAGNVVTGGTGSNGGSATLAAHLADYNNPHRVNKTHIGLGLVQNYGVATESEAELGFVKTVYMTPYLTKLAIAAQAASALAGHLNDVLNPHQVTKAQVGLGSVENYAVATSGELTDGTSTTAYMTPLGTKQMINTFAPKGNLKTDASGNYFGVYGEYLSGTGTNNLALGTDALSSAGTGSYTIALGYQALQTLTAGLNNIAIGQKALNVNSSGDDNIAVGQNAIRQNAGGYNNIALGENALAGNAAGYANIAIGWSAMACDTLNQAGANNIALGWLALTAMNAGSSNVAVGYKALTHATKGDFNVAIGESALDAMVAGHGAIAIGYQAQANAWNSSTVWDNANVAIGYQALQGSTIVAANTGNDNVAIGWHALQANSSGSGNIALGRDAMLGSTTGADNVALGNATLGLNSEGSDNVAIGWHALAANTTASNNIAIGKQSLTANLIGHDNIALGCYALVSNTNGYDNIAVGREANYSVTTAVNNIAIGTRALRANTIIGNNIAIGTDALKSLTTQSYNVAIGISALTNLTDGANNLAIGYQSLYLNAGSQYNVGLGNYTLAGSTGAGNTAIGYQALNSNGVGTYNTAIGYDADVISANLNYATAIGAGASVGSSNTLVLGRTMDTVVIGATATAFTDAHLEVAGYIRANTAAVGENSTIVATTAYVQNELAAYTPASQLGDTRWFSFFAHNDSGFVASTKICEFIAPANINFETAFAGSQAIYDLLPEYTDIPTPDILAIYLEDTKVGSIQWSPGSKIGTFIMIPASVTPTAGQLIKLIAETLTGIKSITLNLAYKLA